MLARILDLQYTCILQDNQIFNMFAGIITIESFIYPLKLAPVLALLQFYPKCEVWGKVFIKDPEWELFCCSDETCSNGKKWKWNSMFTLKKRHLAVLGPFSYIQHKSQNYLVDSTWNSCLFLHIIWLSVSNKFGLYHKCLKICIHSSWVWPSFTPAWTWKHWVAWAMAMKRATKPINTIATVHIFVISIFVFLNLLLRQIYIQIHMNWGVTIWSGPYCCIFVFCNLNLHMFWYDIFVFLMFIICRNIGLPFVWSILLTQASLGKLTMENTLNTENIEIKIK